MQPRILLITAALLVTPAFARANAFVEADGVEVSVPDEWQVTPHVAKLAKGEAKYVTLQAASGKGRFVEIWHLKDVTKIEATPQGLAFIQYLFPKAKLVIANAKMVTRDGIAIAVASGKLVGKAETEVDLAIMETVGHEGAMLISYASASDDPVLRKANLEVLDSVRVAGNQITVTFDPTKTKGAGVSKTLTARLNQLGPMLGSLVRFPRPLPINIKDCGVVNAFYKPGTHTISVCHEMADFMLDLFTKANVPDPAKHADDVLTFIFLHEFGHALAGELSLPITGKGEDDADELATLISSVLPEGRSWELAAAQSFDITAKKSTKYDFADEHSLDPQREATIVCNMYGAHPKENAGLLKLVGIDARRADKCVRDFAARKQAWDKLMQPYYRDRKKVRH